MAAEGLCRHLQSDLLIQPFQPPGTKLQATVSTRRGEGKWEPLPGTRQGITCQPIKPYLPINRIGISQEIPRFGRQPHTIQLRFLISNLWRRLKRARARI